jgi:hypothetical protein
MSISIGQNSSGSVSGEKLVETVTNVTRFGVTGMTLTNISASCSGTLSVTFELEVRLNFIKFVKQYLNE